MNKDTMHMLLTLQRAGISEPDAFALRRIAMTLHRWHELECGTGEGQTTYSIERETKIVRDAECLMCGHKYEHEVIYGRTANLSGETSAFCPKCGKKGSIQGPQYEVYGRPYMRVQYPTQAGYVDRRLIIPDREAGALRRLAAIMARYPALSYYVQGDPRGAALYVLRPGDVPEGAEVDAYYSRGLPVYK